MRSLGLTGLSLITVMATANIAAPDKFTVTVDSDADWRIFRQKYELYILAAGLDGKSDEVKVALLLTHGGGELLRIYNTIDFGAPVTDSSGNITSDPSKVLATVLKKFDEYFAPRKLVIASRYRFRCCKQNEEETIDNFITRLRTLVKQCDFSTERDEAIRDQIVFGCRDDKLREKFLREENISLLDTLKICEAHQASHKQMQIIKKEKEEKSTINKVRIKEKEKKNKLRYKNSDYKNNSSSTNADDYSRLKECKFCGEKHIWSRKKCPAFGKKCSKCGQFNHFASVCKNGPQEKSKNKNARVNAIDDEISDSSEDAEYILGVRDYICIEKIANINEKPDESKYIFTLLKIDDKSIRFQIDSGSGINVIPLKIKPKNIDLIPCEKLTLEMWNTTKAKPLGKCRLIVKNPRNSKKCNVEFVVIAEDYTPLIGKRASEQMSFITVNYENICIVEECRNPKNADFFNKYSDVFSNEVGNLPGTVHITVNENIVPFAVSSCRVPIQLKEKVKLKLSELENNNVICKVDEPTEWVSRMVAASKKNNSDIRLCINPQQLN